MKYRWLEGITCAELSQLLACEVKSILKGRIPLDEEGLITGEGVEIELEGETPEILEKLDMILPELKREGGKSLVDEITQLKDRISSLEEAKAELNP